MEITERQKQILNTIIEEHISSALPVSSQLLEKKYDFGICPATIRIEMQKLTDKRYLYQPYTSAGRIPTDKGYRLFVDELQKEDFDGFDDRFLKDILQIKKEIQDSFRFAQVLTKKIAEVTSNLTLSYLFDEELILKEGWGEIIREPEFEDAGYFSKFIEMVESWEKNIDYLDLPSKAQIYIGRENPFLKNQNFSAIISKCCFPEKEEGILAILGPTRMAYDKNIRIINSLTKIME